MFSLASGRRSLSWAIMSARAESHAPGSPVPGDRSGAGNRSGRQSSAGIRSAECIVIIGILEGEDSIANYG
jgi:hypothetical protein